MRLFWKKHIEQNEKKMNKTKKPKKASDIKIKYKKPADVKLFYNMPIVFIVGVLLVVVGLGWATVNNREYASNLLGKSMAQGRKLPLWGGDSKGDLTLGRSILSKDGKDLAVEIKYSDEAHNGLSSFGDKYELRLVKLKNSELDFKMSYGIFGTDGSGVLQVHSNTGFQNISFVVMIVDRGQLVTSQEIRKGSPSVMNNSQIDDSITSRLSNPDISTDKKDNDSPLPPLYYVRLNGGKIKKSEHNWANDSEIVSDLFIKDNLKIYKDNLKDIESQLDKANLTLDEMKQRLVENPDDKTAKDNEMSIQQAINSLERDKEKEAEKLKKLNSTVISKDILNPKQTEFKTFEVNSMDILKS